MLSTSNGFSRPAPGRRTALWELTDPTSWYLLEYSNLNRLFDMTLHLISSKLYFDNLINFRDFHVAY